MIPSDDLDSIFGPDRTPRHRSPLIDSRDYTLSRLVHDLAFNRKTTVTAAQIEAVSAQPDLTPTGREKRTKPKGERDATAPYTTKYLKKWIRRNGGVITASELFEFRTQRYKDALLKMDAWALIKGQNHLFQAGTNDPCEERDHLRKFVGVWGFEFAEEHLLTVNWVEFVRSSPDPVRVRCWVRKGVREPGYYKEQVAEMCG